MLLAEYIYALFYTLLANRQSILHLNIEFWIVSTLQRIELIDVIQTRRLLILKPSCPKHVFLSKNQKETHPLSKSKIFSPSINPRLVLYDEY